MKLPKLYARTATGATQIWEIEIDETPGSGRYRTLYGQQGGAQIVTEWTVCTVTNEGRANERSIDAQAQFEAQAMWDKKQKSGGYNLDINNIDTPAFFEPMLAHKFVKYENKIDWKTGVLIDLKYNGKRLIAQKLGMNSRTGEPSLTTPHIFAEYEKNGLFDKFPDIILDGEGFSYELRQNLNDLMSILNKRVNITTEDLKLSEQAAKHYVYDGINFEVNGIKITQNTPCVVRRAALKILLKDYKYAVAVEGNIVHSKQEMEDIYQEYLADGQEGIIVRNPNAPYINGRTKYLLKLKPTDSSEFELISIEEGTGNWAGYAKKLKLKMSDNKVFGASFKGSKLNAKKCLAEKDQWIGQIVTINFNGYTGLGIPNFAQFPYLDNSLLGNK